MSNLQKAASIVINECMGIKNNEKVLIIIDKNKLNIGFSIFKEASKVTKNAMLVKIPISNYNGQEPPEEVAREMLNYDVILMATTRSLSHTNARKDATEKGARIASMPGITEEIMKRTLTADYYKITERSNRLRAVLDEANKSKALVKVYTRIGTNISMLMGKRTKFTDQGLYHKKGDWGNLPAGEAGLAPIEGSSNGIFIVDASMGNIGRLNNPIRIEVKDGYAIRIEGKTEARKLKELLESFHTKDVYNIAELGIGTNDKAIISGTVLEDEKVLGTAHIALGNNFSFGGSINAPVHLDGVFLKPTIIAGDKKIMENGTLLI